MIQNPVGTMFEVVLYACRNVCNCKTAFPSVRLQVIRSLDDSHLESKQTPSQATMDCRGI